MTKHRPRRRKARALLVATAGLAATLTLSGCPDGPFGNLKAPDCDLGSNAQYCERPDLSVVDLPFGNLADFGHKD